MLRGMETVAGEVFGEKAVEVVAAFSCAADVFSDEFDLSSGCRECLKL